MSFPTYDIYTARDLGLFRSATAFVKINHDTFLIRARKPFYVEAHDADILDLGLKESRDRACL